MCGLYASIGLAPDSRHLDVIAHRGPDGSGWRTFPSAAGPVALGHRRLAIIDLDGRAGQPMSCQGMRFWITYNGEIYNFLELRVELEAKGVQFRTTSDTEVLLQAYVTWGESALHRLVGMFAFVIYDSQEQRIFAARDRFGIKPLYYCSLAGGVVFASEIKQLVGQPGFRRRLNLSRAYDYLLDGYTDHTAETMFQGASQLRGGQCVALDLSRWRPLQDLGIRQYYELPACDGASLSAEEAAVQFRRLFQESVRLHLRSDVRVGSCLSGGLDSSSIVVTMDSIRSTTQTDEPIHTISACYVEKSVDERPFIKAVIARTRTEPHFTFPSAANLFALAEKITWHQDEPYTSTSLYAQWCVFEEAKRHAVKVILDGQGADEQLAGYHEGFEYRLQQMIRRGEWRGVVRLLIERRRWHGLGLRRQLLALPERPHAPSWVPLRRHSGGLDVGWIDVGRRRELSSAGSTFEAVLRREGIDRVADIGDLCVAYIKGASLPRLLRYEDRNSMAHSIEARVPFLDHRLVEFSVRLGSQHKMVGGNTKSVLRRAMAGRLPESVRLRRDKLGFQTPEEQWFRGPLRPMVEAGVRRTLDMYPDLMRRGQVLAHMQAALDGKCRADFTLWRIVNLGIWGAVFDVRM